MNDIDAIFDCFCEVTVSHVEKTVCSKPDFYCLIHHETLLLYSSDEVSIMSLNNEIAKLDNLYLPYAVFSILLNITSPFCSNQTTDTNDLIETFGIEVMADCVMDVLSNMLIFPERGYATINTCIGIVNDLPHVLGHFCIENGNVKYVKKYEKGQNIQ